MRLVKQKDKQGCSVACLAMILGKDYYTTRKLIDKICRKEPKLLPRWEELDIRLYPDEVYHVLDTLCRKPKHSYAKWKLSSKDVMFLVVSPLKTYLTLHAVIFDGKSKLIYDPAENEPIKARKYLSERNIINCIKVR